MHRNIAIFFVILLFLGCLGASQEPSPGGYYNSTSQLSHTEKASLVGSVIDASGRPIAGVMVAIAGGGRAFNTTSDEVGEFSLENIPAGRYAVLTVFAKGYEMKVLHDVELEANHTKRLEFRLKHRGN